MSGALERFVWSCVAASMWYKYIRSGANCEQFRISNSTQALFSRASWVRLGNATNSASEFEKRWSRHPKFLEKFFTVPNRSEYFKKLYIKLLMLVLTKFDEIWWNLQTFCNLGCIRRSCDFPDLANCNWKRPWHVLLRLQIAHAEVTFSPTYL